LSFVFDHHSLMAADRSGGLRALKLGVPGLLAVRYLQIESKMRALVHDEQATQVLLAP